MNVILGVQPDVPIPLQRKACKEFIDAHQDWVLCKEMYERGVSGYKVSADKRDAIVDIRAEALKKSFDILLVFLSDRLGRREDETPFVVEWFSGTASRSGASTRGS